MSLSPQFLDFIGVQIGAALVQDIIIDKHVPVSGGDINKAYQLQTNAGTFMLKVNHAHPHPDLFICEGKSLNTIAATKAVAVPEVIANGKYDDYIFLAMEWINVGKSTSNSQQDLGRQLAAMHKYTNEQFGFFNNNYMGTIPQSNRLQSNWSSFFIYERLMPLVQMAFNSQLLQAKDLKDFEALYKELPHCFEEENPALIHGDLWGGNYLIDTSGNPFLIDPAITYGHREFDIAMATLFGGFSQEFYQAYREAYPLAPDWQQRLDLWNIYPLLVHLNLFGMSYLQRVRGCVSHYI